MYYSLLITQYIGIGIVAFEFIFLLTKKPTRIQRDIVLLLLCLLMTFVSYTMEMQAQNLREAMLAIKFGYIGKPFIMIGMVYLITDYCRLRIPKRVLVLMACSAIFVTVSVFTTELHWQFYTKISFTQEGFFPHVEIERGPFYQIYSAIIAAYAVSMVGLCLWQLKVLKSKNEKNQMTLFTVMILISVSSFIVYLTGVTQGYDCTLLGYLFATMGFSFSVFKLNLLDTVTLAQEQAVEYVNCGILVYDNYDNLLYHNAIADSLNINDKVKELAQTKEPYNYQDKVYSVQEHNIEQDNISYGKMFFIQDMTWYYNYEKQLRKEKERADKANASKSDFLSRMSHDLRTPMNGILGMATLAEEEVQNPEATLEDLRKIKSSSRYMIDLLNEILDMAKIESGKLEVRKSRNSLGEIIEFITTTANTLCQKTGATFYCNVDKTQYMNFFVNIDRLHFQQVIVNLLSNASKFTPPQGRIEFLMNILNQTEKNIDAEFIVSDTGSGMTKEFQKVMFEAFMQDENSINKVGGTGLGLAIVKSLVEMMGGSIECVSAPGEGTTFTIKLAIEFLGIEDAPNKNAAPSPKPEEANLVGKKILLAEDNKLNQEISCRILKKKGIEVTVAENGLVALNIFSENPENTFDLVLMDVMMPVMGGLESARLLRSLDRQDAKKIPIIALTANAFADDIQKCIDAGMNTHLAKPIDPHQLLSTIASFF